MERDRHWARALDELAEAPFEPELWPEALGSFARLCRSRIGQLWGWHRGMAFNWLSEPGLEEAAAEFLEIGGDDPRVNPRVRVLRRVPLLKSVTDEDIALPKSTWEKNPLYTQYYKKWDTPFVCIALLSVSEKGHVGASVLRSSMEGPITPEDRSMFDRMTPHIAASVRTQAALEEQGAHVASGAFEALSIAAVLCDGVGRMISASPCAEEYLRRGDALFLHEGRLGTRSNAAAFASAVAEACAFDPRDGSSVSNRQILVRGAGQTRLILDVAPLPQRQFGLGFGAKAVVIVREAGPPKPSDRVLNELRNMYGLTAAELQVASLLAEGRSRTEISAARGVSVETVRAQSRVIFDKLQVRRQIDLLVLFSRL